MLLDIAERRESPKMRLFIAAPQVKWLKRLHHGDCRNRHPASCPLEPLSSLAVVDIVNREGSDLGGRGPILENQLPSEVIETCSQCADKIAEREDCLNGHQDIWMCELDDILRGLSIIFGLDGIRVVFTKTVYFPLEKLQVLMRPLSLQVGFERARWERHGS
jgi:hypothetical protein